jgi:glycosyltransferase involved in cell wall biosynthesis
MVQFHGSYIPLQGIDIIVEAARILKHDTTISFRLIGEGQEFARIKKLVATYGLKNISFLPWLSIPELNTELNRADLILGIFGDSGKAGRVIPNKIFQGLAVKKPVLTKKTLAVEELFSANELYLINDNKPQTIADAIVRFRDDAQLRATLATNGHRKVMNELTQNNIGKMLYEVLKR